MFATLKLTFCLRQTALGVPSYVTPVRRSTRTIDGAPKEEPDAGEVKPRTEGEKLQQMLESVDYAYAPNEVGSNHAGWGVTALTKTVICRR